MTVYQASRVQSNFYFDAGGNRAKQLKQRIAADHSRMLEETLYLGSYEREIHMTKASAAASPVVTRTVHRHSLGGFAVYTKTAKPGMPDAVKLSTILKDHLGSTDVILTSAWNGTTFANPQTERQSFDPWGERRAADTFVTYRATDSDPFRTSAQDYDRGYTGHEQLDDSGLIHMNGRLYDPELGRMLSPDPVVQVPEFSQNFNRYSYVMNNPLNLTDPTGFSWLSKAFHKLGNWLKQNWRTVVVIVVGVILVATGVGGTIFAGLYSTATGSSIAGMSAAAFYAGMGAVTGGIMGGLTSALAGGDLGDVLRGAAVGAIQGAISGGVLRGLNDGFGYDNAFLHVSGHGVLGGATNGAMGGKFQDGFLSAAASAAGSYATIGKSNIVGSTIKSGVIGGTASALGGGKFANGARTAAFQHLLNAELGSSTGRGQNSFDAEAANYADLVYDTIDGGALFSELGINYHDDIDGFGAALYGDAQNGYVLAYRGTSLFSPADWKANILQAFGFRTSQYDQAVSLAIEVSRRTGGNVTFVGHSLGGGLASAAAGATGGNAITFNSAGVSGTYRGSPGKITANFILGDILSLLQDGSPIPNAAGHRVPFSGRGGPILRHLMDQFTRR